jgi:hypothetical protein
MVEVSMIAHMREIFGRSWWLLRMHYWLWREKRSLAKLQSLDVARGVDRPVLWQGTQQSSSLGEPTLVTELAEQLRLQPFLLGDGESFIEAMCAAPRPDDQPTSDARKELMEREARLIADYDAQFLASIRIKSFVLPLPI